MTVKDESNQIRGDDALRSGVDYEAALRALWLLDLRGSDDALEIISGEDAKLIKFDGQLIYRQIKKRDGKQWTPAEVGSLLPLWYERFVSSRTTIHEFYTNAAISSTIRKDSSLNPSYLPEAVNIPQEDRLEFCASIRLYPNQLQAESSILEAKIHERLRSLVLQSLGKDRIDLIASSELSDLVLKLRHVAATLAKQKPHKWADVNLTLGLDELLQQAPVRGLRTNNVVSWNEILGSGESALDNDLRSAISSIVAGEHIPRSCEIEMRQEITKWQEQPKFKVIILTGAHGTGKTWSLVSVAQEIARPDGMTILVAGSSPAAHGLNLNEVGAAVGRPAVILIDEFCSNWPVHVFSGQFLAKTPPILILATASLPQSSADLQELQEKLGPVKLRVLKMPDLISNDELQLLAQQREHILTDRECALRTNIRHAVEILSGHRIPPKLSDLARTMRQALYRTSLGAVLVCAEMRLSVPARLIERILKRSVPEEIRPWLLARSGTEIDAFAFVDPERASEVLHRTFGSYVEEFRDNITDKLLTATAPGLPSERVFARRMLAFLSRAQSQRFEHLISTHGNKLEEIVSQEPMVNAILLWFPILKLGNRRGLIEKALLRVPIPPRTFYDLYVLKEAYKTTQGYLLGAITHAWTPEQLTQVMNMTLRTSKTERRAVSRVIVDLLLRADSAVGSSTARPVLFSCLETNCQEVVALAMECRDMTSQEAMCDCVEEFFTARAALGSGIKKNWLDAYLKLLKFVLSNPRFRAGISILESIAGSVNVQDAERRYGECYGQEQALPFSRGVNLLLQSIRQCDVSESGSLTSGEFFRFVYNWGTDQQRTELLQILSGWISEIDVTRVSAEVVSHILVGAALLFIRTESQPNNQMLQRALQWLPSSEARTTTEACKLSFTAMVFAAAMVPEATTRSEVSTAYSELVLATKESYDRARSLLNQLGADRMTAIHPDLGLPPDWPDKPSLAQAYLRRLKYVAGYIRDARKAADRIHQRWEADEHNRQDLCLALLALHAPDLALRIAERFVLAHPEYPDAYVLRAISRMLTGQRNESYEDARLIVKAVRKRTGPHPGMLKLLHYHFATAAEGDLKYLHLLCMRLNGDKPLPPLGDWKWTMDPLKVQE